MLIVLVLAACSDLPAEAPASALVAEAAVERATLAPAETPGWPAAGAPLRAIPAPAWSGRPLRLVVDAGHGAPGNLGNTSVRCEQEADFTRRTQDAVIERLRPRPDLALLAGRPSDALRSYDDRIVAFDAWKADAVISLHSDTRAGDGWTVSPTTGCYEGLGATGFAVLYSDEGADRRVGARQRLARAVGRRLAEAGFPPYGGVDYTGLYAPDTETAGVFLDRHAPSKRIRMLRGLAVPLVIIETHQAVDPAEVDRWNEPATLDAFAAALHAAVIDAALAATAPTAAAR